MQKEIDRLNANFETLVQDQYIAPLTGKELKLSRGYSVSFIPQKSYDNGVLSIYMSYMFKGPEIEKWLDGWFRENDFVDFKNHFILFGVQGKPIEFYLYEKKTGAILLHASALKASIKNQAFIYFDYPNGDDNYYIYDLTTGNKTQVQLPDPKKYPWVTYGNAYESVFIKDRQDGYYLLSSTEDESTEFTIKVQ